MYCRPISLHSLVAFALIVLSACQVTSLPLWGPDKCISAPEAVKVERIQDVSYTDLKDADPVRHKLDLYLPADKKDFPVVILLHGGAWVIGDNRCCGLYSSVGEFLASRGIGAVLPNYRLSPGVKHPEHIKDVARAFAWTHTHIKEYGGRQDQIFLVGHSAGGHLASLLTTDEQYLKAEGCKTSDIQGVIAVSGVYRIPEGKTSVVLGGASPQAFHVDTLIPLRSDTARDKESQWESPSMALSLNVFGPAFGDDSKVRQAASPVNHVRKGLPPFLLVNAERDLPLLPAMAEEFHQELVKQGCESRMLSVENRNHNSIMFKAIQPDDPVARAILDFIKQKTAAAK